MSTEPYWEHDCDQCVFLGHSQGQGRLVDLYYCETRGHSRTVIARYGEDGDYASGWGFINSPALLEAMAIAKGRGLVPLNTSINSDGALL